MRNGEITEKIRERVKGYHLEGPVAVCISGGIDSSIILYHVIRDVVDGNNSEVFTFTSTFGTDEDEGEKAKRVADFYGTTHTEVKINRADIISRLPFILRYYPFPRYNVWPWIVIDAVRERNLRDVFIGEGGDEIFGYSDRTFLEGWAGQLVWTYPAWEYPCNWFDVRLHAPFREMEVSPPTKYYNPPEKAMLRKEYDGLLPGFIINQRSTPPSNGFYKMMRASRNELQVMAAQAWLETR